ncbi:tyrosine-type recombinase/integrase [Actinosynnema mirum]|uniref:Integrase family protein n=1 Tax=Actinosynnema mirum (strain ATCC 29888 / DSM 43827 / JCM 3225 / NBRC 14064 / NCIMB 13271 / NRRL B-12336 / IMRU 3971 / 101) TaxID=446462 RepID=C6WDZ8_ACTMD|nr:site-specific integrase [Actinosynnema mirum]ACU34143.1 integrase family protein [Actinosynnema mirum DSM 43827]
MPREKKGRSANGRSSIYYSETDQSWHGWVTVGTKDNGQSDRRHVRGKNQDEVSDKVSKLERMRDQGRVTKAGQNWTVETWLKHWLENIVAPPVVSENAYSAYEVAVRVHLVPGIGAHRLVKLQPEHLEKLYRAIMRKSTKFGPTTSSSTAHQVHRTIRAALNVAVRRKHLTENPALEARAPKLEETEVEPYSVDQVKALLVTALKRRNSARWAIALALGLRQGEALGLRWQDVDLEVGTLVVRRNRLRPKWRHGCTEPCGKKHGGYCPQRVALREETAGTKSAAGKRGMGLPDELVRLLRVHRDVQARERERAAELWTDTGYVFTTPTGGPLNPRSDYDEWKRLLDIAKVPDGRLHDARHTAATVLLLLGVPERTVMGIMGWSNTAMAARYQHVTAAIRLDVAQRVGGLLWEPAEKPTEPRDEGEEGDATGALIPTA